MRSVWWMLKRLPRRPVYASVVLASFVGGSAVALADARQQPDGRISGLVSSGHGIIRSSRAIKTFAVNSFDYKYSLLKVAMKGKSEVRGSEYREIKSEIHRRSAERLLQLCEANRGVYIKAGQFIASLQHLPKEYSNTLSVLQDKASYRPFKAIQKVLVEELGENALELFSEFDPVPIAAASLAQVHKAKLKNGTVVAVKVQYPGLAKQVEADMRTMLVLSKAVGWLFPEYQFGWMIPEFQQNLAQQLNFEREGKNAERTAENFEHKTELKVPKIHWDLTTKRILCMQFVEGCKVDDVDNIRAQGIDPKKVATVLLEVFAEMVFCHGFVHGDPHPGNVLVKANHHSPSSNNFDLILLDHGLYKDLEDGFRSDFCKLWKALILRDQKGIKETGEKLGAGEYYKYLPVLFTGRTTDSKVAIGQELTPDEVKALKTQFQRISVGDLTAVAANLPKDLFIVMRTDSLVRQIIQKLGAPRSSRLTVNAKYAIAGLSLKCKGGPDFKEQGWVACARATLDFTRLFLIVELLQFFNNVHVVWSRFTDAVFWFASSFSWA